jgi:hypothetical protein
VKRSVGRWCVVGVFATSGGCLPRAAAPDCYEGFEIGRRVEIELVAPYGADGPYPWQDMGVRLPSCNGIDGLDVGVYTFRVHQRGGAGLECFSYSVVPDEPLGEVMFGPNVPPAPGPVVYSQTPHCGGWWRLQGLRHWSDQDHNPFDEVAQEGQVPPIRLQRFITGDCDCFDEWVAEIRHVSADADAGTRPDGGS